MVVVVVVGGGVWGCWRGTMGQSSAWLGEVMDVVELMIVKDQCMYSYIWTVTLGFGRFLFLPSPMRGHYYHLSSFFWVCMISTRMRQGKFKGKVFFFLFQLLERTLGEGGGATYLKRLL